MNQNLYSRNPPRHLKDSRKITNDSQSITNFNHAILMYKQSLNDSTL